MRVHLGVSMSVEQFAAIVLVCALLVAVSVLAVRARLGRL